MASAFEGVLVTCDAALCQHILHVDEQQQKDPSKSSFVIKTLDDRNLLIKEEAVDMIQAQILELQNRNHFSKSTELPK